MFFNTGIGTYIWILTNHKETRRKGKVQLINLAKTFTSMRKSEGSKRRYISDKQINDAVYDYGLFEESENIKIFETTDFSYRKVTIRRPLRAMLVINQDKISHLQDHAAFMKLSYTQQKAWERFFESHAGTHKYSWAFEIVKEMHNKDGFGKTTKALATAFISAFMVRDEDAEPVRNSKGEIVPDNQLNDTENVPYGLSVEEYFEKEVLPHVPDAFIDYSVRDQKDGLVGIVGYEINFNRYFYKYTPPRPLKEIDTDLKATEARIQALLDEVAE